MLGVTKANVSAWENGRHTPSPQQIASISRATGVSLPEELSPSTGRHLDHDSLSEKAGLTSVREKVGTKHQDTFVAVSATFSESEQNRRLEQIADAVELLCNGCGYSLEDVYFVARNRRAPKGATSTVRVTSDDSSAWIGGLLHKKSPRKAGNQEGG